MGGDFLYPAQSVYLVSAHVGRAPGYLGIASCQGDHVPTVTPGRGRKGKQV